MPDSVFSAGGGRGSVEAWYTSALDIEEVLSGASDSHLHLFVANVVKSFDAADRKILDRVLSCLGLPGGFRHAYFEYHAHVRLRFELASGLGEPSTRDGGIPQGCPLSVMFIVALYLPWCRYLAAHGRFSLNCMLIILSVFLGILVYFCMLLDSLLVMSGWSVKSLLPVSVSC